MRKILGSFAILLVLLATPSAADAQCARCKDPWWGADYCVHCSSGNECGESCHFDTAGNCYLPLACGSGGGGLASLSDVLRARGIAVLPAGMSPEEAGTLGVQEIGDQVLLARSCDGQMERLWRIADGQVLPVPMEPGSEELRQVQRLLHLQALLE